MGKRPKLTSFYDQRDTRGKFESSEVHPVQPEPCPVPQCGFPDSGPHDCPGTFDDFVGAFAATPVGPVAKHVAANPGMPPFLRLKQALENAALSAAAYRNDGEEIMLIAAWNDLEQAEIALKDLAAERDLK